jgi:GDP-4-dehydro-6-deoxy-D-mannose reductase
MAASYCASRKLHTVRVRPFNHIGAGQGKGFAVADFTAQIIEAKKSGEKVMRVGNLAARRDFSDVRDVVTAYILLMAKGQNNGVYNIGSGKSIAMSEILEKLLQLADAEDIKVVTDPALVRPVDTADIVADNSKVVALGWEAQYKLEETLAEIVRYWEELG